VEVHVDDALRDDGRLSTWRGLVYDQRQVRILRGTVASTGFATTAYASLEVLLDGLLSGATTWEKTLITFGIADPAERLDKLLHEETYAGTGGFEGPPELAGVYKPCGVGIFRAVEPQPVGTPSDHWHDVDPVHGLDSSLAAIVEDGGVPYTNTASNPPAAGQVYVDYANGRIRLPSVPGRKLTVTARSAFASSAVTAADIMVGAAAAVGMTTATELDTSAFTALNTANSNVLGRWFREPPRALGLWDECIKSVGGWFTTKRGGQITTGRWSAPTATAETDPQIALVITDDDLIPGSLVIEPVGSPPRDVEIGYARCHTIHSENDLNGAATEARRSFLTQEYRYASATGTGIASLHLGSDVSRRDTMLDDQTGGLALAQYERDLYAATGRWFVRFSVKLRPFSIEPASEIWVRSTQHVVDAAFRLFLVDDQTTNRTMTFGAWR
jgi:hypothetical protein